MTEPEEIKWPSLTDEMDDKASKTGVAIYNYLKAKFPDSTVKDADLICNSLCFALVNMAADFTRLEDRPKFIQLIVNILSKNLIHETK